MVKFSTYLNKRFFVMKLWMFSCRSHSPLCVTLSSGVISNFCSVRAFLSHECFFLSFSHTCGMTVEITIVWSNFHFFCVFRFAILLSSSWNLTIKHFYHRLNHAVKKRTDLKQRDCMPAIYCIHLFSYIFLIVKSTVHQNINPFMPSVL